jgi:hypothetical protein
MPKTPTEDDVLRRMLKTPPQPFTPKKDKPKAAKPKKKKGAS